MKHTDLQIGQHVYHKDIYNGNQRLKVIGIKETKVELEGDYSGGTHNVCQADWLPIKGVITKQEKAAIECVNQVSNFLKKFNYPNLHEEVKEDFLKIINKYT